MSPQAFKKLNRLVMIGTNLQYDSLVAMEHPEILKNLLRELVDGQGRPTRFLSNLLDFGKIKHDGTLPSIVLSTQKYWLRPQGAERWQLFPVFLDRESEFRHLFTDSSFFNEISPSLLHYDYVLCLGTTYGCFKRRFNYLKQLLEKGVRCKECVVLTGQRPLDPLGDDLEEFLKQNQRLSSIPQTETDLAEILSGQMLAHPAFTSLKSTIIDTPMHLKKDRWLRPTTKDTIEEWLKSSPRKGSCLIVTSQPYAIYHDAVFKNYLPYPSDIVAPARSWEMLKEEFNALSIGVVLDSAARALWELNLQDQIKID